MEAARSRDKYSERVETLLGRSRQAEGFVAAGAVATLALAWATPVAWELQLAAIAWVGACARAALGRLRAVDRLAVDRSGEVVVGGVSGRLRPGSFVAPWLTVVRWRPLGAWLDRTVLVVPDMLAPDDFRRLRVLLRWGNPATARFLDARRAGPARSGDNPASTEGNTP